MRDPIHKLRLTSVGRKPTNGKNAGIHSQLLTQNTDFLGPVHNFSARGPKGLKPHKNN